MWKRCKRFIVHVEFDHLVDKPGVDTISQLSVVFPFGGKFAEQQDDSVHLSKTHYFFHFGYWHRKSRLLKSGNKGFRDIAVIPDGGAGNIENDQLDRAHVK